MPISLAGMKLDNEQEFPVIWLQKIVDTTDSRTFAYQCLFANSTPRETALALCGIGRMRRSGIFFIDMSLTAPPATVELGNGSSIVCQLRLTDPARHMAYLMRLKQIYSTSGSGLALAVQNADAEVMRTLDTLRPHYIKLQQSLVRQVEQPRSATAIRRIVELADERGLTVIAEGVRTRECMEDLWLLGVRNMQGDLYGQPSMSLVCHPDDAFLLQNDQSKLVNPVWAR